MEEAKWYVVHTYSGYEINVRDNIQKTIRNKRLEDQILEVIVPTQEVIEVRNNKKKLVSKKLLPGYVLIHMIMNDDTWYIVRNTRGVTGFVGPGSKPVPLTEAEMKPLGIKFGEEDKVVKEKIIVDFEVGDTVVSVNGVWKGKESVVTHINHHKQTVTIKVDMMGRETPVELSFADVKKVD